MRVVRSLALAWVFALMASSALANGEQERRLQWIKDHGLAIRSIDPDDDEDFADLMPLKAMIGDARLVTLGEQSHGDGAVFYAKARLIKFLHQHLGFDVLAWESGMFDCREVDRALRNPEKSMIHIQRMGVFPIWTASAQVLPTLEYVRSTLTTEHPIETCGFDHQFSGAESRWARATIAFFDGASAELLPDAVRASLETGMKSMLQNDAAKTTSLMEIWKQIPALMDEHRTMLEKTNGADEFVFMRRAADDAVVSLRQMLEMVAAQAQGKITGMNTRDLRMGENLIWLVNEKYKGRKIIAWMASAHAVHDIQKIKPPMNPGMYEGVINCGTVAHKALGGAMYTIGFTAHDGRAGNVWANSAMTLAMPQEGSLEDLCFKSGRPFVLIDFKSLPPDHWLRGEIISRPLGYAEMSAIWPKQLDAMFYIETMFPSTRHNALPKYARIHVDQK